MMNEEPTVALLTDIRNWIRAASYVSIKSLLEKALPDAQSRTAYQMLDGSATMDPARAASRISPNKLISLTQRWTAMGLMELSPDKKRKRLFDLADFELIDVDQ
jgi:hypothetical protein